MGESSKDSARQDASSLPVLRREVFECTTHDMCTLTMWRCFAAPTAPTRKHSVVLCHGLASNRFTFDLQADVSVVDYLAEQGWDTWLVELRGSGMSKNAGDGVCSVGGQEGGCCFDDHLEDCRAIIEKVHSVSGKPVHFIGHSMGAMLLQCAAGGGGAVAGKLRSGVSIGGSLFMEDSGWKSFLVLWPVVKYLPTIHANFFQMAIAPLSFRLNSFWDKFFFCQSNVDPKVARQMFRKNWEPMSTALLGQLRSAFKPEGLFSRDGTKSYVQSLAAIRIPMLVLAGAADKQCPPSGLEKLAGMVAGCQYECLGRDTGQAEQYGHFDLIVGARARDEVWGKVLRFLEHHDR